MRHRTLFIAVLKFTLPVLLVAATTSVRAAEIFSDNFESVTPGNAPSSPWTTITANGTTTTVLVQEDTLGSLFGVPGNRYAEFIDNAGSGSSARADSGFTTQANGFITISFDFYEVAGIGLDNEAEPDTFNVQIGQSASSTSGRSIDFRLSNGEFYHHNGSALVSSTANADYSLNTRYHIDIVANHTASSAAYGAETVAAGSYDVWLNGVLAASDLGFRNNLFSAIDSLRLGTDNDREQRMAIDNFVIRNEAYVVPEPNSAFLLSLGCLLLVRRRKS